MADRRGPSIELREIAGAAYLRRHEARRLAQAPTASTRARFCAPHRRLARSGDADLPRRPRPGCRAKPPNGSSPRRRAPSRPTISSTDAPTGAQGTRHASSRHRGHRSFRPRRDRRRHRRRRSRERGRSDRRRLALHDGENGVHHPQRLRHRLRAADGGRCAPAAPAPRWWRRTTRRSAPLSPSRSTSSTA